MTADVIRLAPRRDASRQREEVLADARDALDELSDLLAGAVAVDLISDAGADDIRFFSRAVLKMWRNETRG